MERLGLLPLFAGEVPGLSVEERTPSAWWWSDTADDPWYWREEHRRWEFDLENENICGHWSGVFTVRGPVCEFESTETIRVKRALMRPFARAYLHSQQRRYMADLQRALSRR